MHKEIVYSATLIIRTLFIRNLDYPDLLETNSTDLFWPKLADLCTFMNAADHDHAI